MPLRETASKPQSPRWLFASFCIVAVALTAFAAYRYWRAPAPPPPPAPPLPISKADEQKIREGMQAIGKTLLGISPEQQKKLEVIWQRFPTTVDELIAYNKKTDEVLTEKQRLVLKPVRRLMRHQAIDQMLERSRSHFPPADFEKFKQAIKDRVDRRAE